MTAPTGTTPLVETRGLEKSFSHGVQRTWVLRQVDLAVREGEFVTIMGPSGAGKTTLLAILGMLDHEWQGEFFFDGQPVHEMKPRRRVNLNKENIGFVFQQYHLLDDLTVAENLDLPLSYRKVKRQERQALVADILDRFQIVGKKDLYPTQLSGGQQQLVAVARAVIAGPRLILADEPTGSLHTRQGEKIMELLSELNREHGTTIVQVTHNEAFAQVGDRIVEMVDGWVQTEASVDSHQPCIGGTP